jgi:hypothetical protein
MPNLHAFDLLGNFLGKRIDTCADVRSSLADMLADKFGVENDRIAFDCREDGAEYIFVNGEARGYVLQIDWDGGWHQAIPFGVPDRSPVYQHNHRPHDNDNTERLTHDLALVARVMADEVSL